MKIAIAGINGRMGRTLVDAVRRMLDLQLVAGSAQPQELETAKAALMGEAVALTSSGGELVSLADAVIDFTTPAYSLALAKDIAKAGKIHIIGTTGFSDAEMEELKAYGAKARIVQSGNFSIGVNVAAILVEQAAKLLDDHYDIEIVEMHHRHKKDAPSGTALMLGEAAAHGRETNLQDVRTAHAGISEGRKPGAIGIVARRGGEVIGDHTVTFAGNSDVIEITHRSQSREIYAEGALKAALWAESKAPGFYSMRDVLGL